jgi:hypothetical protein
MHTTVVAFAIVARADHPPFRKRSGEMAKTNYYGALAAAAGVLVAVGLLVLMLVVAEARPAGATFPGKPDKIAFSSFDGNDDDIYTVRTPFQVTDNTTSDSEPSF